MPNMPMTLKDVEKMMACSKTVSLSSLHLNINSINNICTGLYERWDSQLQRKIRSRRDYFETGREIFSRRRSFNISKANFHRHARLARHCSRDFVKRASSWAKTLRLNLWLTWTAVHRTFKYMTTILYECLLPFCNQTKLRSELLFSSQLEVSSSKHHISVFGGNT